MGASVSQKLKHCRVHQVTQDLWTWRLSFLKDNAYLPGEPDRVLLFVSLKAEHLGKTVFNETWCLDAWGDERGTAMGRLVSVPFHLQLSLLLRGELMPGVQAAPHDPKVFENWLSQVKPLAQYRSVSNRKSKE